MYIRMEKRREGDRSLVGRISKFDDYPRIRFWHDLTDYVRFGTGAAYGYSIAQNKFNRVIVTGGWLIMSQIKWHTHTHLD